MVKVYIAPIFFHYFLVYKKCICSDRNSSKPKMKNLILQNPRCRELIWAHLGLMKIFNSVKMLQLHFCEKRSTSRPPKKQLQFLYRFIYQIMSKKSQPLAPFWKRNSKQSLSPNLKFGSLGTALKEHKFNFSILELGFVVYPMPSRDQILKNLGVKIFFPPSRLPRSMKTFTTLPLGFHKVGKNNLHFLSFSLSPAVPATP